MHRLQDWEAQGALSATYLAALRELLLLLPNWEGVEGEMEALLGEGAQAAALCVGVLFTGGAGCRGVQPSVVDGCVRASHLLHTGICYRFLCYVVGFSLGTSAWGPAPQG